MLRPAARIALTLIVILLVCGAALYATAPHWLPAAAGELVYSEAPRRSDVIVVLGGDFRGFRIMAATELMQKGYAPQVLVSGAGSIYGFHESDLAVDYAVRHGAEADRFIKFPYPAVSTRDEAHAVVRQLRSMGVRRFLVVTSNFHTHRAARIFRAEAPDLEMHMISAGNAYFPIESWWKERESRKIFFDEWLKTLAYNVGI